MVGKRGLSPIIATVLLVSISLVLAVIIFAWASTFVSEQALKFDSPVEFACENVNFDADVVIADKEVSVVNRGNVPLFGVEVRTKALVGGIQILRTFDGQTISVGQTKTISIPSSETAKLSDADEVVVVPIILGDTDGDTKAFTCDEEFGVTANVI